MSAKGCKARVDNKWYHQRDYSGKDHPCPFKAISDGYCARHHPRKRLRVLQCRKINLARQLAQCEAELEAIMPEEGAGNPS